MLYSSVQNRLFISCRHLFIKSKNISLFIRFNLLLRINILLPIWFRFVLRMSVKQDVHACNTFISSLLIPFMFSFLFSACLSPLSWNKRNPNGSWNENQINSSRIWTHGQILHRIEQLIWSVGIKTRRKTKYLFIYIVFIQLWCIVNTQTIYPLII